MREKDKNLKSGYSTGSYATSALKAALMLLSGTDILPENFEIVLPDGDKVHLDIDMAAKTNDYALVEVIKGYNDDIDVTKGCKITCFAGFKPEEIPYLKHKIAHKPYKITVNGINIFIHAGSGLGVVTKEGIKPPVGYPAINPGVMEMIANNIQGLNIKGSPDIHVIFQVENGEEIAGNTANSKVGVVGGISFLGKKGIVKPISSDVYLEAIEAEINVASNNPAKTLVLTMGNDCLEAAHKVYGLDEECYVEIGNFVFDSLELTKDKGFNKIVLASYIGKLTKVAQGLRNTNNKFGVINFKTIQSWLELEDMPESITTVSGLESHLRREKPELVRKLHYEISINALNTIKRWAQELEITDVNFEILFRENKVC